MVVTCPSCGALSSDREFCDHCNADLVPPTTALPPSACPVTAEWSLALAPQQLAQLSRPEAAILVRGQRQVWRLHWIAAEAWPTWQPSVAARCATHHPALPPCRWTPDRGGVWVIAEASGRPAHPWLKTPLEDPFQELRRLKAYLEEVAGALVGLRMAGWQWLTFDPRELEYAAKVDGPNILRITNLDLQLTPVGQCSAEVHFCPFYAAPEVCRFDAAALGAATDVFHLCMAAYYWIARMLPAGFLGQGLEAFGHRLPPLRVFAPTLAPGIAPVLQRALATRAGDRFATPVEFCSTLGEAITRAESRHTSAAPVTWEIATTTRTGKAKQALGKKNEDAVLNRRFADPARALVAIADGISTCDVGTGAHASLLTCLALDNTFDATCTAQNFAGCMTQACQRAATNLLTWALERGQRLRLETGAELMGTTLTAGWLEDNQLHIANLGDSRVYLLGADFVDQLTVDGDLGCSLLAAGAAPEHLVELGGMARALRECVGGCERGPGGELTVVGQHNRPTLSCWTLLPGDVVVLCTDGLVEEGVYLEAAEIEQLVRRHVQRPVDELAKILVDAADARQHLPSLLEPEGMGDNISCVVVRIAAKE
jgi:serine/threonine protein phosphatase PrpC